VRAREGNGQGGLLHEVSHPRGAKKFPDPSQPTLRDTPSRGNRNDDSETPAKVRPATPPSSAVIPAKGCHEAAAVSDSEGPTAAKGRDDSQLAPPTASRLAWTPPRRATQGKSATS